MTLVCPDCFGEKALKRQIIDIRPNFNEGKCDFHPTKKGVPINEVAKIIDEVFRSHFGIGQFQPRIYDDSDRVHYDEQDGDPLDLLISELAEIENENVTERLIEQLIDDDDYWPPDGGEPFYSDSENYVRYEVLDNGHSDTWESFCETIKHSQRFFNTKAEDQLKRIFSGVEAQKSAQATSPVYRIMPGDKASKFYRARIVASPDQERKFLADPVKELGGPPPRLRRAGRMNPAGVLALYGAYDVDTCISELRPAVGNTIVVAQFELVEPIHVLDLRLFKHNIRDLSFFNPNYKKRNEQWSFMRVFAELIAKPVLPSDEHVDYIPTQAVAEFLSKKLDFKGFGDGGRIAAIIFNSAQRSDGANIVVLGESAEIELASEDGNRAAFDSASNAATDAFSTPHGACIRLSDTLPAVVSIQSSSFKFSTKKIYSPEDFDEFDF